ncbi:uncharacterized protein LOC108094565 [Drosophila ficusphila]|uniref:uncharacterized protein LOC108094565 n=1 Tax=Drosophila ficusphila TaxID=30025 RepID=UPI001C8A2836|nr:uncharacterized protein LOC108094565 [Drosophila ficusphila]
MYPNLRQNHPMYLNRHKIKSRWIIQKLTLPSSRKKKKPLISQENNAVKCSLDKKSLTPSQNKVQESKPTFSLQEKKPTNNQKNISNWQQDKKPLIKNQANNSVKLSFDKKPAFALKHKKVINASRKIEQPVGDSMVRKSNMFELLEESESPSTCIEIEEDDVSLPDAKKENVDPRTSVNSKKLKRRIKKRETAQRNLQLAKERAAKDAARAKKSREKAKALRAATLKSDDESLRLWTPKSDEEELEYWSALSPHLRLKPHEQQPEATKSDDLTEDNQFKKPNSKIIKQCRNSIKPTPKEVANEPSKTIANDVKNSQILQEENHKLKELEPETDASAESLQLQFPGSNLESPQSTEQHTISPRSRKNSRLGQLVLAVNLGALKRPNEGRHTSHRTIESRKWEIYYRKLPSTLRCSPNLQLRTTIIYVQEKGTETVVELLKRIKSNPLRIKPDLRDCKLNRMLDKTNSDCQALDSGGGNCDPEANKLGKLTNFLPFGFEATRYRAPIVFRLPVSQGSGVRFGTAFPLPIRMPGAVAPPSPPTAPIQIGEPFPSAPRGRRGRDQKLWNKRKVYQKRYCPFRRPHVDEVGSSDTE